MDYILYNSDGSIKLTNFTEFINKGSNNVNKIFVGLTKDSTVDLSSYDVYAIFKLPNGQAEPVGATLVNDGQEIEELDETWYGYEISLSQDVTCYAGLVKCTIKVEKNDEILFTYPVVLTINDTAIAPEDLTLANLSQYENLKEYIKGKILNLDGYFALGIESQPVSLFLNKTVAQVYELYGNNLFAFYIPVLGSSICCIRRGLASGSTPSNIIYEYSIYATPINPQHSKYICINNLTGEELFIAQVSNPTHYTNANSILYKHTIYLELDGGEGGELEIRYVSTNATPRTSNNFVYNLLEGFISLMYASINGGYGYYAIAQPNDSVISLVQVYDREGTYEPQILTYNLNAATFISDTVTEL